MAPALPPYQVLTHEEENKFRAETIKECKILLKGLKDGIYVINWEGEYPNLNISNDLMSRKKLEIRVESKLQFSNLFQMDKPVVSKKIRICGNKQSCIDTWSTNQLIELNTKLLFA